MSNAGTINDQAKHILEMAESGDLSAVEESWLELVNDPPSDPTFYEQLLRAFRKGKQPRKSVHDMTVLALEELEKRSAWKPMERILMRIVGYYPDSTELRRLAESTLHGRYSSLEQFDQLMLRSKIAGDVPLDKSLRRFRGYLRLLPGQVYRHDAWGVGVVRELDLKAGRLVLDFPEIKGKQVTLEGIRKFFTWLKPGHFQARVAREPEKLKQLAEDHPVEAVKLALASLGPEMKQADLKSALTRGVIVPARWNSWWTRARRGLKHDPYIAMDASGGAHAMIALRDQPRTVAEEARDLFFAEDADLSDRVEAVGKLAEAQAVNGGVEVELLRDMLTDLGEAYLLEDEKQRARRLEIAFLAEDLRRLAPELEKEVDYLPEPQRFLMDEVDYERLLEISHPDYAVRAFQLLVELHGDEARLRAAGRLHRAPVKLAQAVWKEVDTDRHREAAAVSIESLIGEAMENPETYLWAVKAILNGEWNHVEDYFHLQGMVLELFDRLEDWQEIMENPSSPPEQMEAARLLTRRVIGLLSARSWAPVCEAAERMTLEQAQRLRRMIEKSTGLNSSQKSLADKNLRLTRRDLEDEDAVPSAEAEVGDDVVLCTPRARHEKMQEYQELTQVRIPANSKAIEMAREEGDLRENAGYHAAKDEQKMLMQKMLQLREALSVARVIEAEMVNTDSVSFGTRVETENPDGGEKQTYVFLGRWEADPDRNILSISAPLARQFLGKRVGEEFTATLPGGGETRYRIVSISNALESGQWELATNQAGASVES